MCYFNVYIIILHKYITLILKIYKKKKKKGWLLKGKMERDIVLKLIFGA